MATADPIRVGERLYVEHVLTRGDLPSYDPEEGAAADDLGHASWHHARRMDLLARSLPHAAHRQARGDMGFEFGDRAGSDAEFEKMKRHAGDSRRSASRGLDRAPRLPVYG